MMDRWIELNISVNISLAPIFVKLKNYFDTAMSLLRVRTNTVSKLVTFFIPLTPTVNTCLDLGQKFKEKLNILPVTPL